MNNGPEHSSDRSDVSMFEVAQDEILQKISACCQLVENGNHQTLIGFAKIDASPVRHFLNRPGGALPKPYTIGGLAHCQLGKFGSA
jgi:hypothetical protein